MTADLIASVRMLLGTGILSTRRLHGGDLSDVTHLILDDGREVVAKTALMWRSKAGCWRR